MFLAILPYLLLISKASGAYEKGIDQLHDAFDRIEQLEAENQQLKQTQMYLLHTVEQLSAQGELNRELSARVEAQATAIESLQTQLDDQRSMLEELILRGGRQNAAGEAIGFSAYATGSYDYQPTNRIQFEGIEYSSGNYSTNTSEFVCPVSGTYFFNVNVYFAMIAEQQYDGWIELYVGGSKVIEMLSSSYPDTHWDIISNSVVTTCNEGQKVHCQCMVTSTIYGDAFARRSTFNGFLIA